MGFLLILYLTTIDAWPVFIKSYPCSFFNIKKTLSDDSANDFQGFFPLFSLFPTAFKGFLYKNNNNNSRAAPLIALEEQLDLLMLAISI